MKTRNPAPSKPSGTISFVRLSSIRPSPENDRIYKPVNPTDRDIIDTAASMKEHGVLEALVITKDGWIVSGHRRYAAAKLAGLESVPVIVLEMRRSDDIDHFIKLLREYNRSREKSNDERLREAVIDADPEVSYQGLQEHRRQILYVDLPAFDIVGKKCRAEISKAKVPMMAAISKVLASLEVFWPVSDRQIHYKLLNDPPLKHASKPDSLYSNDKSSYKSLTELVTRMRLTGDIPMHAIADETRPVSVWPTHATTAPFVQQQINDLFKGYWRNLMSSQPCHIELIGEKNTLGSILREVAATYTIPLTTGRGYCSVPPRAAMAERFKKSGKDKLVVLIIGDLDPDGQEIGHSFARSMRDEFGVENIHPIRIALTPDHVRRFKLPHGMKAKTSSMHYEKFVKEHGRYAFEVEAVPPEDLQKIVRDAIDSVIDTAAYNREVDAEKQDAAFLQGVRQRVNTVLSGLVGSSIGGN